MGGSGSKVIPLASSGPSEDTQRLTEVTANLASQIKQLEEQLQLKDEACRAAEDKLSTSQQQVESMSADVLQLQERLSHLEHSDNSHSALEHMVRRLERELSSSKEELEHMREGYERRLQRVRSSSAKSQAESALSLFELRDENQRLTQENARLLEQIRQRKESSSDSCGHMQLIIDLSQQLSTLQIEAELQKARAGPVIQVSES